jgi:hypothetical protein
MTSLIRSEHLSRDITADHPCMTTLIDLLRAPTPIFDCRRPPFVVAMHNASFRCREWYVMGSDDVVIRGIV